MRIAAATSVGSYSGNVTVTSTGANTNTVAVSGTVEPAGVAPVITATNIPGTVGVALSTNIIASGVPTSYAIASGTLPGGLTLNTTSGAITGNPTESVTNRIVSVTASNSVGTGSPGDLTFNIAKGTQSITNFTGLPDMVVGGSPRTLAAGTVSGLTVTYASSNNAVASVSNNIVTAVAPGITTITASQAGNANWNAATSLNQSIKVTGPLLVAWDFNGESNSVTSIAEVYDSNLDSVNTISRGSGAAASQANNTFRTAGFNNDGIATTNNDFFQIALSAKGGRTLSLTGLEARVAGSSGFVGTNGLGASSQFAYSTDGTTFTLIGSPFTATNNTTTNFPSIDLSGISALQNVPAGTTVTFRFYATGQSASGGTWGFISDAVGQYGLAVTGTTTELPPGTPLINPSVSALTGLSYTGNGPSTAQSLTLSVSDLTNAPGNLTVTGSSNFEVSTTDANSGFGSTATLAFTDASTLTSNSIWVRLKAGLANGNYGPEIISVDGGGASTVFTASGTATVPSLTLSTTNLGTFTATNGVASAARTFTVTGTNLSANVLVTPPAGFEVSTGTNAYAGNLSLAPTSGNLATTTVNVRLAATNALGTIPTNTIVVSSTGATDRTVSVAGQVVNGTFTLAVTPTALTEGGSAASLSATLSTNAPVGGLTINITSNDTDNSEVELSGTTLTVAEGATNSTTPITVTPKSDGIFDLPQTVVFTGTATNWASAGTVSVTVANVDAATVTKVSLTNTNPASYTQNFNALGTITISNAISGTEHNNLAAIAGTSALNGWYAARISGSSSAVSNLDANAGTSNGGGVHNYGATSGADLANRSLGLLASGTRLMVMGALIQNDTGETLNGLRVSAVAKLWRSTTNANTMTFGFGKVDGTTVNNTNFLTTGSASPATNLNATFAAAGANTSVDGNLAANQTNLAEVYLPMAIAPGETVFIRWRDNDESGNDAGIGIDDVVITASAGAMPTDGLGGVTLANPAAGFGSNPVWPRAATNQSAALTVTGTLSSGTIEAVKVVVPTAFTGLASNNVVVTGTGAGTPLVSLSGSEVLVTGLAVTQANPAVITLNGLTTPQTAGDTSRTGDYAFTVQTGTGAGSLQNVASQPTGYVVIPIAHLGVVNTNGVSIHTNKVVAVEGVCTEENFNSSSSTSAYLQSGQPDGTNKVAVNVYSTLRFLFTRSNQFTVLGKIEDYNGLTEVVVTNSNNVINFGLASNQPTAVTLTIGQLTNAQEAYEGSLVRVTGLSKVSGTWATNQNLVMQAGGTNLNLRVATGSAATTEPIYPAGITGIYGQFVTNAPFVGGGVIQPRDQSDIEDAAALVLTLDSASIDEAAPFNTATLTIARTAGTAGAVNGSLTASPGVRMRVAGQLTDLATAYSFTIADGQASTTVNLVVIDDSIFNSSSLVTLTASATGLVSGTASLSIADNEVAPPTDTTPPVITIVGDNPLTILWGGTWLTDVYQVSDNVDGTNVPVTFSNTVNTKVPGTYIVTYTARDSSSNSASTNLIVNVRFAGGGTNRGPEGLPDAVRFALGADGTNRMDAALMPSSQMSGNTLVLNYHGRPGTNPVELMPVVSTNLADSNSWGTAGITVTNLGQTNVNGVTLDRRQASVPTTDGTRKFLRLRATTSQ